MNTFIWDGKSEIPKNVDYDTEDVNNFEIIQSLINHNIKLDKNTFRSAVNASHAGTLNEFCKDYPLFGTIM